MTTFNIPSLGFEPHGVNASGNLTMQSQLWAHDHLASQSGGGLFDFDQDDDEDYRLGHHNVIRSRVTTLRNTAPNVQSCVSESWGRTGGLNAFRRSIVRMTQNNHFDGEVGEEACEDMTLGAVDRPPKLSGILKILRKELDSLPPGNLYKQSEVMKRAFSKPVIMSAIMREYSRYVENDIKRVREEKYQARLRGVECEAKHKVSLAQCFYPDCGMCCGRSDATEHTCLPKDKVITLIRSRIERWFSCNEGNIRKCKRNGQSIRAEHLERIIQNVNFTRVKQVRSAMNKTNPMIGISIPSSDFCDENARELVMKTLMSLDNCQNTGRKRRSDRQLPVKFHSVDSILERMKEYYMVNIESCRDMIVDSLKRFSEEALIEGKRTGGQVLYARVSEDERETKRRRMYEESERQRIEAIEKEFKRFEVSEADVAKIGEAKVEEMWQEILSILPDEQSFGGFVLENGVKNEGPLFNIMNTLPDDQDPIFVLCQRVKECAEWIAVNKNDEARQLICKFWGSNFQSNFQHIVLGNVRHDGAVLSAETIAVARSYYYFELHHTRVATLNEYLAEHIKECRINNVW
jgi:hypothetical protein